jgi:hypothetical protein
MLFLEEAAPLRMSKAEVLGHRVLIVVACWLPLLQLLVKNTALLSKCEYASTGQGPRSLVCKELVSGWNWIIGKGHDAIKNGNESQDLE